MTLELNPSWAFTHPYSYFKAKYDERLSIFNVIKENRKRKGLDYEETDMWVEKMKVLLAKIERGAEL